ncbi:hypothetical protein CEXT_798181 [Caerostris extrusa]|uniref:Uncharacterized protein n=1 Tax=Caerostris extrusa TaxID=172846 RepID=A0AAV4RCH4_CAEEX|nr:hypothetical protein CEXT_798181 [Caerostris extrusa]
MKYPTTFIYLEYYHLRIVLSICCEIWKNCSNNDTTEPSTVIATKSLEVSCGEVPRNVYEEVSKDLKGIRKLQELYPIKFYAKTQIQVERKTFIHHINDFSSLQSTCNFSFIIHSTLNRIPPLHLTMGFADDLPTVKIYISHSRKGRSKLCFKSVRLLFWPTKEVHCLS